MTFADIKLYEKLTGRRCPIPVSDGEVPMPDSEHMERYEALCRLAANEDFATFLVFARERSKGVLDGNKANKTTDLELRSAKAQDEAVNELGVMVIKFIRETEELLEKREKWLAERGENGQTAPPETRV